MNWVEKTAKGSISATFWIAMVGLLGNSLFGERFTPDPSKSLLNAAKTCGSIFVAITAARYTGMITDDLEKKLIPAKKPSTADALI